MSLADLGRLGSQAEDGGSSAVGVSMFIDISFFHAARPRSQMGSAMLAPCVVESGLLRSSS